VDATHEKALETPIHMLIASFRDRLCPRTLHNAFSKAENPKRIFIRVIQQTLPGSDLIDDAGCFDQYCQDYNPNCEEYRHQVRIVARDARVSKGPTDARSKLSAMIFNDYWYAYDTERLDFIPVQLHDFCLQLDSHMDFSDRYDTGLIAMHHRTQNDYSILSTYVADIAQNNKNVRDVPNLCMVQFTSTIRNWGTKICHDLVRPKLTNMSPIYDRYFGFTLPSHPTSQDCRFIAAMPNLPFQLIHTRMMCLTAKKAAGRFAFLRQGMMCTHPMLSWSLTTITHIRAIQLSIHGVES
jgi:hypothetical protein